MGGVGTARPNEPARRETEAQPGSHQWHRPRFEGWLPLAGFYPEVYGPHTTIYNRFNRWSKAGIWQTMLAALVDLGPTGSQSIDSTTSKAHRCAAGGREISRAGDRTQPRRTDDARFIVANASGRLIAFDLTPGQMGDVRPAAGLIDNLPKAAEVLADTAYDSDKFREFLIARGSTPVIKPNPTRKKNPAVRHGVLQGSQRDRARLLALEGLATRRNTIRQAGQKLSRHRHARPTLQVVDLIESGA